MDLFFNGEKNGQSRMLETGEEGRKERASSAMVSQKPHGRNLS